MKYSVLSSGSQAGNSILVASDYSALLVDCGLSAGKTDKLLHSLGYRHSQINTILYTHGHIDHHVGAEEMARKWAISSRQLQPGTYTTVGGFTVESFPVPHDGGVCVGYAIEKDHARLGIVLDAGCFTDTMINALRGCHALILGADYDETLLAESKYRPEEKERIASNTGHCGNLQIEEFLRSDWDGVARTITLAHLSQSNNTPELATAAAVRGIMDAKARWKEMPEVIVSLPLTPTKLVEVVA